MMLLMDSAAGYFWAVPVESPSMEIAINSFEQTWLSEFLESCWWTSRFRISEWNIQKLPLLDWY